MYLYINPSPVLPPCLQVLGNLGAADIDSRLEEQLIDGILYAFQEQTNEVHVVLPGNCQEIFWGENAQFIETDFSLILLECGYYNTIYWVPPVSQIYFTLDKEI